MRFHRTNYDGPGKFDERETGTKAFDEAARAQDDHHNHHHEHEHVHVHGNSNAAMHNSEDTINHVAEEDKKVQIQQLLRARYDRRSGSYARRGYTIGIGGPGESTIVGDFISLICKMD